MADHICALLTQEGRVSVTMFDTAKEEISKTLGGESTIISRFSEGSVAVAAMYELKSPGKAKVNIPATFMVSCDRIIRGDVLIVGVCAHGIHATDLPAIAFETIVLSHSRAIQFEIVAESMELNNDRDIEHMLRNTRLI